MALIINHFTVRTGQPRGFSRGITALLLLVVLSTSGGIVKGQDGRPSRQAAEAAWASGDYEKAYNNYNGLLLMYSRDPAYAYYTGACLVELQRDIPRAVTLLRTASQSSQNVKTIPDEIWYYYGRALQMTGSYNEAATAYNKYSRVAGKKKAQEYDVPRCIAECNQRKGVIDSSSPVAASAQTSHSYRKAAAPAGSNDDGNRRLASLQRYQFMSDSLLRIARGIRDQIDKSPGEVKGLMRSRVIELETQAGRYLTSADSIRTILSLEGTGTIADNGSNVALVRKADPEISGATAEGNKPVATIAPVVPDEYDRQLTRAMKLQYAADSLNREASSLRRKAATAAEGEKNQLTDRATAVEAAALRNQKEADAILLSLEPGNASEDGIDTADTEETVREKAVVKETVAADTSAQLNDSGTTAGTRNRPVSDNSTGKEGVYSFFELKDKPAYSESNPVPVGTVRDSGLVYHIQLAAFRNPVSPSYFRNLYPVFGRLNGGNGVTYYYTGMFRTRDAAVAALPGVRQNGFADAFVVPFIDDVQVSMEKAVQVESRWASVPLFFRPVAAERDKADEFDNQVASGTLIFRAEVIRSAKPVKPDVMDKIELLAGSRQLDIIRSSKGETVILIGKFITFESAQDYVSLLNRNGYSSAKVTAWVGESEIPVESARELRRKVTEEESVVQ